MAIGAKTVLVATDFTGPSNVAVRYGHAVAKAFHATLHVLHVLDDLELRGAVGEGYIGPSPTFSQREQRIEQAVRSELFSTIEEDSRAPVDSHLAIVTGNATAEILRYAQQHHVDLIIMGTHGRNGFAHLVFGSVSEAVVRRSPCPVLVVHDRQHDVSNITETKLAEAAV